MAELDLIPADYARRQLLRRQLQRFMAALALLASLVGLARLALHVATGVEKREVVRLQAEKQRLAQGSAQVEEYQKRKTIAEKQLAALDELRGRNRLRLFLHALDAAYVENLWLDEITYYRRDNAAARPAESVPGVRTPIVIVPQKSAPTTGGREFEQRVGITGHASNHALLAQFMRNLEKRPGVADVSLLDTSPRAYPNALVIDIKLSVLIDEKAQGQP
jgi:hypothetical protein